MEFRIITYNIFGARLTNGRELARSLKKYNPDFIGLQEVDWTIKMRNWMIYLLQLRGLRAMWSFCVEILIFCQRQNIMRKLGKIGMTAIFKVEIWKIRKILKIGSLKHLELIIWWQKKRMIAALRRVFILMMIRGLDVYGDSWGGVNLLGECPKV